MATAPLVVTREDGQSWSFDAATSYTRGPRARTTDHPVESGTSITDHVIREPDRHAATATVTRSPLGGREYGQPTGREREQAAVSFLEGCWDQMLTITWPDEEIENYVLVSMAHERGKFGATKFSLEFREIVVVEAQTVTIPVTQAAESAADGLASEVDGGEQSGDDPDTTEAEEDLSESWLYQIIYGDEQEEAA